VIVEIPCSISTSAALDDESSEEDELWSGLDCDTLLSFEPDDESTLEEEPVA
jgi:hypothetical protein